MKGLGSSSSKKRLVAKEDVAEMLENYRRGIQKVALMLQDQRRTRFIVVCIAEYLSVSETQRLLRKLKKNQVRASHIIVNQVVVESAQSVVSHTSPPRSVETQQGSFCVMVYHNGCSLFTSSARM